MLGQTICTRYFIIKCFTRIKSVVSILMASLLSVFLMTSEGKAQSSNPDKNPAFLHSYHVSAKNILAILEPLITPVETALDFEKKRLKSKTVGESFKTKTENNQVTLDEAKNRESSSENLSKNDIKTNIYEKWHVISPGIEHLSLRSTSLKPWSSIHVFRIDLKKNFLSLITAREIPSTDTFIKTYVQYAKSKPLIAINGGFFDNNHSPLGLRITNSHEISPLKNISWWGVFYIKNQKSYITKMKDFRAVKPIEFAIQSGPRLIINNQIPSLKPGKAERSALGITHKGEVLLLITDNHAISTTELAHLMRDAPLNCINALNLDGGHSSQLEANTGAFLLHIPGFSRISDAILVNSRN